MTWVLTWVYYRVSWFVSRLQGQPLQVGPFCVISTGGEFVHGRRVDDRIAAVLNPDMNLSFWAIRCILKACKLPGGSCSLLWNVVVEQGNTGVSLPRPQQAFLTCVR
jgi:hypothetical protein